MTTNLSPVSFNPWPGSPVKSDDDRWASAASIDVHSAVDCSGGAKEKKRGERREREHTEDTESEPQEINREVIVEPTHRP